MKLTDVIKPGRIIFRGRTYTPDEVRANIDDLARHLSTILPPDKPFVYLSGVNHAKFIFAYFAIIKAGHICVIVDPKTGPIEYGEYLEKVSPAAVIKINCDTMEWDLVGEIQTRDNGAEYTDELDDVCTMIFHAADDGYAKALMLTNRSLWADAEAGARASSSTKESLFCVLVPYHTVFGLGVGILVPFVTASGIRIDDSLRTRIPLEMKPEEVTDLYTTPVVLRLILKNRQKPLWFSQDVKVTSGGLALPVKLSEEFRLRFGIPIRQGYGLSEASPVCTWNRPGMEIRPESVGTAIPCSTIKIVGEDGSLLPAGIVGNVVVTGSNLFKGYYGEPVKTREVLCGDGLDTRDTGYLDGDGYLYLTGNRRRMLNVMGTKVFPAEVERIVLMHSNVSAIRVFGEFREILGNAVRAEVSFKQPGINAIKELQIWCKKFLTPHKIPLSALSQ